MKRTRNNCDFDSILIICIDETLMAYGKDVKNAFYEYFKKAFSLPKHKIPERIDLFSSGLEDLFGVGSRSLEILIMMKLHSKIGVVWEYNTPDYQVSPDMTFKNYVSVARKRFEECRNYEDAINIFVTEKEAKSVFR